MRCGRLPSAKVDTLDASPVALAPIILKWPRSVQRGESAPPLDLDGTGNALESRPAFTSSATEHYLGETDFIAERRCLGESAFFGKRWCEGAPARFSTERIEQNSAADGRISASPVPSQQRKCASMRTIFESPLSNPKFEDWVADDAVRREPFSGSGSLISRENAGNLANSSLILRLIQTESSRFR